MATTIRCTDWDDSPWDDAGLGTTTIMPSDTFTVASVETGNRVLRLAVQSSTYAAGQIKATQWDDSNVWNQWPVPFTVGQVFTVSMIDLSNRVVWLTG